MKKVIALLILTFSIVAMSGCTVKNEVLDNNPEKTEFIPVPGDTTGIVFGYLFSQNEEPLQESIFLSRDIAYDQPDLPVTISFSLQSDPRGKVNIETGFFYFDNIPPGDNYVITIFAGSGKPIFVMQENSDQPMVFAVTAGESLDLGEIIVELNY